VGLKVWLELVITMELFSVAVSEN